MLKPEVLDHMWDEPVTYCLEPQRFKVTWVNTTHTYGDLASYVGEYMHIKASHPGVWVMHLEASEHIKEIIRYYTTAGLAELPSYPGNRCEDLGN